MAPLILGRRKQGHPIRPGGFPQRGDRGRRNVVIEDVQATMIPITQQSILRFFFTPCLALVGQGSLTRKSKRLPGLFGQDFVSKNARGWTEA